ncbi:MAG: hypothetical protein KDD42_09185, partial [Bdellovibrionales bacterium]|nr:hypothetical protein [Bdellovibrionales bacterium]
GALDKNQQANKIHCRDNQKDGCQVHDYQIDGLFTCQRLMFKEVHGWLHFLRMGAGTSVLVISTLACVTLILIRRFTIRK